MGASGGAAVRRSTRGTAHVPGSRHASAEQARDAPGAGCSGTALTKKLGYGEAMPVYVRGAPPEYARLLGPLPAGVRFQVKPDRGTRLVHAFVDRRTVPAKDLAEFRNALDPLAVVWVSWPKKSSGVATDVTEDTVREIALPLGLVHVKVCAVSETWSALKLVVRKACADRATQRLEGRGPLVGATRTPAPSRSAVRGTVPPAGPDVAPSSSPAVRASDPRRSSAAAP